jgi:hypothetical protein
MSRRDDFPYEMFGSWLDQDAADRLLAGGIDPEDAPPGFDGVARMMEALTGPPAGDELADERLAVAAAVRVLRDPAPTTANARRWRMRSKLARAKVAGLVVVGTLIGTTGMAAANALPDAAQDAVSHALSHVGITLPNTTDETATADVSSVDAATGGTTDATGVDHPAATGEEISRIATTTDATGVAKGAEISTAASGGMGQAGQHGGDASIQTGGTVVVPSEGGTSTADDASGGADEDGSATADDASGGRAGEGSDNAPSAAPTP